MKWSKLILIALSCTTALASASSYKPQIDWEDYGIEPTAPLAEFVEQVGIALADGNISTGTSRINYTRLTRKIRSHGAYNSALYRIAFKDIMNQELPSNLKVFSKVWPLPKGLYQATWDLADSNAYYSDDCTPENIEKYIGTKKCENLNDIRDMFELISQKMTLQGGKLSLARASLLLEDEDADPQDNKRRVTFSTLYNNDTGDLVSIFTIEGRM